MDNSYQRIKSHIFDNLRKSANELSEVSISNEVNNTKNLISAIGLQMFAQVLPDKSSLMEVSDSDWLRMQRELDTEFNVKVDLGILIQGNDQRKRRDTDWWSGKAKLEQENYYWDRYKDYLKLELVEKVVKTIDDDTDIIMNNLENPSLHDFSRYGMVVGHVQSGKTANYSALVCKASDAGYKFIVVVAGGMNNLRDQTQERLDEYFVGFHEGIQYGVGIGNTNREKLPISLTTSYKDFNKQDADRNSQGLNFDNIKVPVLIVIKKNTKTLTNVTTWLTKQYKNQIAGHSMLLIDDESDYASINTNEEDDPTAINKKLRELLNLFRKSVYVAYTATPYANIFIDHEVGHNTYGKDLFPKDFIYALDAPNNYFGAEKIFLGTNHKYIIEIAQEDLEHLPLKHKKDDSLISLPDSLYEAIRVFILNIAIRHLRGQSSKHNSMMIHATRFTKKHREITGFVTAYFEKIKDEVIAYGLLNNALSLSTEISDIHKAYIDIHTDIEFEWVKVLHKLTEVIESIVIREVHQKKTVPLVYRKDRPTNVIVIGGTSLSRGYTLEGLSVSYFLRNTIFYDTLMQMGRWFGYRTNYEDLCRIYMTSEMINNFGTIIEATKDLVDDFKRMAKENMTPEDFGLAVKHHPDSGLQVTARNKLRHATEIYFDMKLDGHLKETARLDSNSQIREKNLIAIQSLVAKLCNDYEINSINKNYLWRNVKKDVIQTFLEEFKLLKSDFFGIKSRMPILFVKKYVEDIDTLWDIALYSGESAAYQFNESIKIQKESRKCESKDEYFEFQNRQVSSGTAEAIVLEEDERKKVGSNRKDIRSQMTKPLLMLHILQTPIDETLAAFGISFPGGIKSDKTVKLKINTVYLREMEAMLKEEEEIDD